MRIRKTGQKSSRADGHLRFRSWIERRIHPPLAGAGGACLEWGRNRGRRHSRHRQSGHRWPALHPALGNSKCHFWISSLGKPVRRLSHGRDLNLSARERANGECGALGAHIRGRLQLLCCLPVGADREHWISGSGDDPHRHVEFIAADGLCLLSERRSRRRRRLDGNPSRVRRDDEPRAGRLRVRTR